MRFLYCFTSVIIICVLSGCASNAYNNRDDYGLSLYKAGRYLEAIEVFETTLVKLQQAGDANSPAAAATLNRIGRAQYAAGGYLEAVKTFKYALKIDKLNRSQFHQSLARDHNNIAASYSAVGEYSNAIKHYNESLLILRKHYRDDDAVIASVLNNLGVTWHAVGDYKKSQAYNEKALAIHLKPYSLNYFDHDTSTREKTLAPEYKSPAYRHYLNNDSLLATQEHLLTSPSPEGSDNNTWPTLKNALSWGNKKISNKVIEDYQQALLQHGKAAANNATLVASDLNNLGLAYQARGLYQLALNYYKRALEIDEKTLPKGHPHIATDWVNIGSALVMLKKPKQALVYFELALNSFIHTLGDKHPTVAIIYNNMGVAYRHLKKMKKSYQSFQHGIVLYRQSEPNYRQKSPRRVMVLTQG